MSEPIGKQLLNAFASAWSEAALSALGCASSLSLIAQREAAADEIKAALEPTRAFPSVWGANCSGAVSGAIFFLFKKEDCAAIENTVSNPDDNALRALVKLTLATAATSFAEAATAPVTFGEATPVDLSIPDLGGIAARLVRAVGEKLWINTFTLTVGENLSSQLILLYAPHGSVEALWASEAAAAASAGAFAATPGRAGTQLQEPSRNIERLLDVELEVVVRFGLTQIPLRELVRIGVGSMIELNRQVDEPVELLVNNRPFARGSVVVVDGYYGVCITEIGQLEERRMSLTRT
jgi:flagellar motor switch protein FliN